MVPAETTRRVPNTDRRRGQWRDIRPHGTEAAARRHRRYREIPLREHCMAYVAGEQAARVQRLAAKRAAGAEPASKLPGRGSLTT